jgi:hypothetical protein
MFGDKKNLKDTQNHLKDTSNLPTTYQPFSGQFRLPYSKTNKLVTALYMVTDILEKDEPIRLKLRTLGAEVVSDVASLRGSKDVLNSSLIARISEIISFLEVAVSLHLISTMNEAILRKEFSALKEAVKEVEEKSSINFGEEELVEFLRDEPLLTVMNEGVTYKRAIGHGKSTRLGVQKGSTLMQVLSDKANAMSDKKEDFNLIRKQRREEIISIIKTYGQTYPTLGGATITDIKAKAVGVLVSCGEKTLQRELVAMVEEGVLDKVGSKRWSRYSIHK